MTIGNRCISLAIAEEMKKVFGHEAESLTIEIRHETEVTDFIRMLESIRKKTAQSNIVFP
jgi:hypothetical protein